MVKKVMSTAETTILKGEGLISVPQASLPGNAR